MNQPRAIPFIVKDSNDQYHLSPEAENFLSTIKTPISVVTVAGMYRTGKSYLLNRVILNRSGGFGVGPTVNPCTKGLWLWGQPISIGGKIVLVVDTQGLGALDEESNHDMKIFCLAVLLSSNFIYNSVGSIDQTALQTLAFVLNLLSNIDKESFSCRPTFLWVVRDFTLQLINDKGQIITPSDYLEHALSTSCTKQPQKLQIRKTITSSFTQRDCFTLIKPLIDQNKLQNLDKISPDQLRPQFISQTIQLRKLIMHSLKQIKLTNSVSLQGQDYLLMCKKYLNSINTGGIPNLMDTWTYIKQQRSRQILENVRQNYTDKLRNKLGNRLPMPISRLNDILNGLREEALHEFMQSTYEEIPSKELCDFLTASEAEMQKLNSKQTKNAVGEILRRQFQPYQKKLMAGYYADPTSYEQDLRNNFKNVIQEKFAERFDIPLLQVDLFIQRKIVEGVKMLEKIVRDTLTRTRESKSETENALQMQIRNLNKITDEQRRKFQQQIFEKEKKLMMLENEKKRIEDTFEKAKKEDEMENGRIKRKVEELHIQGESVQKELCRIQNINSDQQRQIFFLKKQLQKQKALSKQKQQHLEAKLSEIDKRAVSLQQQLNLSSKNWQNQRRQLFCQYESKFQHLLNEKKQLMDNLTDSANHLQQQKMIVQSLKRQIDLTKQKYQDQIMRYKQKFANSAKKQSKLQQDGQILKQLRQQRRINEQLADKMRELQKKYKNSQQQITLIKSQCDKNEAIASQRIGFQQMENQQLKAKISQLNHAYQKMIDSTHYNHNNDAEINFKREMHQVKSEHSRIIKAIQTEYEQKLLQTKKQLSQTQNEKDELHLQYNLSQKRWQQKQKYLNSSIQKLKKDEQQLRRLFKDAQKGQFQSQRQKQSYYSLRVKQLQSQVEEIKKQTNLQIEQILRKSEDTVSFIKQCSDKQKNNFEKRLDEEREKRQRKQKETIQQWKNRLQEEKQHYQSIITELQTRMNAMNTEFKEQIQAIKCDSEIKLQKLNNSALEERMDLNKKIALLQQQIDITRINYGTQLQQKSRAYANSLESCKRELRYECQQQVRAAKQAMDEMQSRFDALKKSHRKSQESNLLLKSQLDKEKSIARQKQQLSSRRFKEIQQRFAEELLNHTKILEENNERHSLQTRRLNEEIQKLRGYITSIESERAKLEMQYDQQKNSLVTKYNYMESKCKRSKQDYQDLLKKFQTTVKTLSNQNQQKDMQRDLDQSFQRMRQQYSRKLAEKEEMVNQERRQTQQKIMRLQTQNKTLRDKLTLFEMRQNHQNSRFQPLDYSQRQQRPLADIKYQMERTQNRVKRYNK